MKQSDKVQTTMQAAIRLTNHEKAFELAMPDISGRATKYTDEELLDSYAIALITKGFAAETPRARFARKTNRAIDEAQAMAQQVGSCSQGELERRGWSLDRIQAEAKPFFMAHMTALRDQLT